MSTEYTKEKLDVVSEGMIRELVVLPIIKKKFPKYEIIHNSSGDMENEEKAEFDFELKLEQKNRHHFMDVRYRLEEDGNRYYERKELCVNKSKVMIAEEDFNKNGLNLAYMFFIIPKIGGFLAPILERFLKEEFGRRFHILHRRAGSKRKDLHVGYLTKYFDGKEGNHGLMCSWERYMKLFKSYKDEHGIPDGMDEEKYL